VSDEANEKMLRDNARLRGLLKRVERSEKRNGECPWCNRTPFMSDGRTPTNTPGGHSSDCEVFYENGDVR
jgi:hypothetical protein